MISMNSPAPQKPGEAGPDWRLRLARELTERARVRDPRGWAARRRVRAQVTRELRDFSALREARPTGALGAISRDPGPLPGFWVPAGGNRPPTDTFRNEYRFVRRR